MPTTIVWRCAKPTSGLREAMLRIAAQIADEGEYSEVIKTVNRQDRWRIETQMETNSSKNAITTFWDPLHGNEQQQYEISGPASVRMFTRVQFENDDKEQNYYIRIREDGYDLGTYYFNSEISDKSYVLPKYCTGSSER